MQLSNDMVKNVRATNTRQEISDGTGGLTLVVQMRREDGKPSAKTFIWRGRIKGQIRKITIGRAEGMKVTDARSKAFEITNAVRDGRDPYQEWQDAKAAEAVVVADPVTIQMAFDFYMTAEGEKRKTSGEKRRYFNADIKPVMGTKLIATVTTDDLAKLVNAKALTSPIAANRLTSLLGRFFKWSASSKGRHLTGITVNPMTGIERPSEESKGRSRVLSSAEIGWFLAAVRTLQTAPREKGKRAGAVKRWATGLEILLRTGQRKSDVMDLVDDEIDFGAQIATLSPDRHKSGRKHVFFLTNQVVGLLRRVHRPTKAAAVFQAQGNCETNLNRVRALMSDYAAKEGKTISHWTVHDLRRTAATTLANMMEAGGRKLVDTDTLKAILGHVLVGAISAYLHGDMIPEKRRVMLAWNKYLDGLTQPVKLAVAA